MKKKTFLFILLLLSFNYLEDGLTISFFDKDILLVMQWIWCFFGLIIFRKDAKNNLNTSKNRRYVLWFLLIMIISTLGPYYDYNQPIVNTLISQRANYSICVLLVLLYIHPSVNDIFSTLKKLALLSVVILVYSIIDPNFFFKENMTKHRLETGSSDLGVSGLLPGFELLRIYFYYVAYKLVVRTRKSSQDLFVFLLLMAMIIIIQNRQSILIAFPVFVYTLFKVKNKYNRRTIILVLILSVAVLATSLQYIIEALLNESVDQLNNDDYNRWQAFYAFLFEWKNNLFNFFFGHGVGSFDSEYTHKLAQLGENRGAYLQDIGFLGSYFFYGIFFIMINYYFILKGFFSKRMPLYLKFWCFGFILIPIYQNWGMNNSNSAVGFAILIYLVLYNTKHNSIGYYEGKVSAGNAANFKRNYYLRT